MYRTKSSEELPELNTVFEWARAARLVRVTGGRLVADFDPARFDVNAANQALAGIDAPIGGAR